MSCVIKDCKNVRRFMCLGEHISFHRFPRKDPLFQKWVQSLNLGPKSWKQTMYVCSKHFNPEDIVVSHREEKTIHNLKFNAVPTLNPIKAEVVDSDFKGTVGTPPTKNTIFENVPKLEFDEIEIKTEQLEWQDGSSAEEMPNFSVKQEIQRNKTDGSPDRSSIKRKKFYLAHNKLKREVSSLHEIVRDPKLKRFMSGFAIEFLEKTFDGIPQALMKRMLRNAVELKKFAITLQLFNAKAYDYVRKTFNLALPSPNVVREWCNVLDFNPGFTKECFEVLRLKNEEEKLVCSLTFKEMPIKKEIDFDGGRNWGFIDIGFPVSNYSVETASEALVLMVVSHNHFLKMPIGYFLVRPLNGPEKANIIKEALIRLEEINVDVTSVTCDGSATHFRMFEELGCNFNRPNLKTHFMHPADDTKKVYAIFDACHLLKLVKNCLADLKTFKDPNDEEIKWEYMEESHTIQEKDNTHMKWQGHKMRLKMDAQTLSDSNTPPTIKFIKTFNDLFDLNFKGLLKPATSHFWKPVIIDTIDYIVNLKDGQGKNLHKTIKKAPFLGFIINLLSFMGIYKDYVESKKLEYILTYTCSQDHLELFFNELGNEWNNNPSALQFMRKYKYILNVDGKEGNCQVLGNSSIETEEHVPFLP